MTFDKVDTLVPWACMNWELCWDNRQANMGYWLNIDQVLFCVCIYGPRRSQGL